MSTERNGQQRGADPAGGAGLGPSCSGSGSSEPPTRSVLLYMLLPAILGLAWCLLRPLNVGEQVVAAGGLRHLKGLSPTPTPSREPLQRPLPPPRFSELEELPLSEIQVHGLPSATTALGATV